jgi:hypothetical protein
MRCTLARDVTAAFELRFEHPEHDGRAVGDMVCAQPDCEREAQTWCPLCDKLLCQAHDELVPARCHDCLSGPADVG